MMLWSLCVYCKCAGRVCFYLFSPSYSMSVLTKSLTLASVWFLLSRFVIITDDNLNALYGERFHGSFLKAGLKTILKVHHHMIT